jgi:competence protein ComEA
VIPRRGATLLVVLLLAFAVTVCGRGFLSRGEEPPAFFVEKSPGVHVLLGNGFPCPGVHQFIDGMTPKGVMEMTDLVPAPALTARADMLLPLRPGEALTIALADGQVAELARYWMPAAQRISLGIPLHPDRMTIADWEDLPGIGPKLALAIDADRQQNGDFGVLERLQRVKGIGQKRVKEWEKYFSDSR